MKLLKVVAVRDCQGDLMKACHQGMKSLKDPSVLAGHFGKNKMGVMVVARWYFSNIFK